MKRQRQYTRKSRRYCRYLRVPSAPRLRPHRHSNLARKFAFFRLTRRQSGRWQPGEQYPGQRQQETRLQRKCSDSTGIRSCAIRRKRGDQRWTTYRRRLCPPEPRHCLSFACSLRTADDPAGHVSAGRRWRQQQPVPRTGGWMVESAQRACCGVRQTRAR